MSRRIDEVRVARGLDVLAACGSDGVGGAATCDALVTAGLRGGAGDLVEVMVMGEVKVKGVDSAASGAEGGACSSRVSMSSPGAISSLLCLLAEAFIGAG